jgi:hypothetical protein
MQEKKLTKILSAPFKSSPGTFRQHHKTAVLSVACSDRDYRQALSEFHACLEASGVDRIVEPGGPLVMLLEFAEGRGNIVERAEFLVKHHKIYNILLIGHHQCGAYKDKYKSLEWGEERIDEQVKRDLLLVKEKIRTRIRGDFCVYLFFMRPEKDRVVFEPLQNLKIFLPKTGGFC